MARIRKDLQFCYLCGRRVDRRHGDNTYRVIDGDHLLPQALFGPAPCKDAWRPKLDVHAECHKKLKNEAGESTAILLHKVYTEAGPDIEHRGWVPRLRSLGLELATMMDGATGETLYCVKGFGAAFDAVWVWVRGLHAAIYQSFLPDRMKHRVYAPMGEAFIPEADASPRMKRRAYGPRDDEEKKEYLDRIMTYALKTQQFDGLCCWGGRCAFVSTWLPKNRHVKMARCVWALEYDHVTEYAHGTPFMSWPWMGWYECIHPSRPRQILELPKDRAL